MVKQHAVKGRISLERRLGRNLSTRRKALGLTQEFVAQQLGVEPETISRFERGVTTPALKTIEKLATVLSITIAELLQESAPAEPVAGELLGAMLQPLGEADQRFVLEATSSLCQYLASTKRGKGK